MEQEHITKDEIENILGLKIYDPSLYQQALVHKSILKHLPEHCPEYMKNSYEKLEFLGDAVLYLVVTKYLYEKYPNDDEGELTRKRTRIVRGTTLAELSKKIGLQGKILMSEHVLLTGGNENKNLLEDSLEAIIGALYQDYCIIGDPFDISYKFIVENIEKHLSTETIETDDNYKDILNNYCSKLNTDPEYIILRESGKPNVDKIFIVGVKIFDEIKGKGKASKKREAEQKAAKMALNSLQV
jgi:ribonuclease III